MNPEAELSVERRSRLTPKQERFAVSVAIEGLTQSDAYRKHYGTKTKRPQSVWDGAYKVASHPEVVKRIKELRAQEVAALAVTGDWAIRRLYELALSAESESVRYQATCKLGEIVDAARFVPTSKSAHVNVDVDLAQLVAGLPKPGAPLARAEPELIEGEKLEESKG